MLLQVHIDVETLCLGQLYVGRNGRENGSIFGRSQAGFPGTPGSPTTSAAHGEFWGRIDFWSPAIVSTATGTP